MIKRSGVCIFIACMIFIFSFQGMGYTQPSYKEFVPYMPKHLRDPFVSPIEITRMKIEKKRPASMNPLENYALEEIRLIGVVFDGKEYLASVVLPNGKGFTVRKGMRLGLNGGKILKISEEGILVREYFTDYISGKLRPRDTLIRLHKKEEK